MSFFRRALLLQKQKTKEIPLTFQVMPMVLTDGETLTPKFVYVESGSYVESEGYKYFEFDTTILDYVDITSSLTEGADITGFYKQQSELEPVSYFIGSGASAVVENFANLETIIVPNNYKGKPINGIMSYCFYQDENIVNLQLNDVISEINPDALNMATGVCFAGGCPNLKSIYFGEQFMEMTGMSGLFGAFGRSSNIEEIKVSSKNRFFDTRENCNALIQTETNTLVFGCKNTIIPSTEITIGAYSFSPTGGNTTSGGSAYIPEKELIAPSHTRIIPYSFYYSGFSNIVIPNTFETIPNSCFYGSAIKNLVLPDGVKALEQWCFRDMPVTDISISKTVTSIGEGAFYGTSKLKNIVFYHTEDDSISIQAHSGNMNGAFYTKTARAVNIYTDNSYIRNYGWSDNGITPTFYHLDGTAWE